MRDKPGSHSSASTTDMATKQSAKPVHPEVRIGHVHLKVADLERVIGFYRDVLGLGL